MATGIFYAFFDKPDQRENLLFFLNHGLLDRPDVFFHFVVTSPQNEETDSLLPAGDNVSVEYHCPCPSDIGAFAHAVSTAPRDYDHYVFMNSTCRGPFLPAYVREDWVAIVTSRLSGDVRMVGPVIEVAAPGGSKIEIYDNKPFVHTFMWAVDKEAMGWIRSIPKWSPDCDKMSAVNHMERAISLEILRRGYNITSFQLAMQGVDWRDMANWNAKKWVSWKQPPKQHVTDPEVPGNYFGIDMHPLELMFIKNCRPASDVRDAANSGFALHKELQLYSEWKVQTIDKPRMAIVASPSPKSPSIGVFCHLYYTQLAAEMKWYFDNIKRPHDVHLTCPDERVAELQEVFPDATVTGVPNRGRDMGGFVTMIPRMREYDLAVFVHSKMSKYRGPNLWRQYLLWNLLGTPDRVEQILNLFLDFSLGVVYPEPFWEVRTHVQQMWWGVNFHLCKPLCDRMGIAVSENKRIDFPAGSMYWFRPRALQSLFDLGLTIESFEPGAGPTDGALQHALERLPVLVARRRGYSFHVLTAEKQDEFMERLSVEADYV